MNVDFEKNTSVRAVCETGSLTVRKLSPEAAAEAAALYGSFEISRENYKRYIGLCEYDDFYGFGGKYEKLGEKEFAEFATSDECIALSAHDDADGRLCGVMVYDRRIPRLDELRFKAEYGGVGRHFSRRHAENALVYGRAFAFSAPVGFPSVLAVLTYAMLEHCVSHGITACFWELYKNIACTDKDGTRYLDTFDYNAYNAYKMLGFEHVGHMEQREIVVDDGVSVLVEPQIIAGLDFPLQCQMLRRILESGGISAQAL